MSRARRTAIAALRILSKPVLLLMAGTAAGPIHAAPSPERLAPHRQTLRAFFDALGSDRVLRTRFAQSPRDVLAERGVDLPGFALPDRLSEEEIERLLQRWPVVERARGRVETGDVVAMQPPPSPPAPVYGPPPGLNRNGAVPPPRASTPRRPNRTVPRPGNGAAPSPNEPPGLY